MYLLSLALVAASAQPADMDALVARAIARVPALAAATETARAQRARADAAASAWWPQLGATAQYSRSSGVPQAAAGLVPVNGGVANVTVRQQIYNFGQLDAAIDVARAQADASEAQRRQVAVDAGYRVREAYLSWAQARGLVARGEDQLRNAERLAEQARSFVRNGVRARIDLTRAEVTVARAKAELVDAENGVEIAHRTLETAMGGEAVAGVPVFPAEPALARLPRADLQAMARRRHPTLAVAEAGVQAATATKAGADRLGLPDISANGLAGVRAQDVAIGPSWQATVNLTAPLFTGFGITHQREAADAAVAAAGDGLRDRALDVDLAVERAHILVGGARARLVAFKAALASARENRQQAENRYRNGVGSIIEVSDALNVLAGAQADVVRGEAALHLAIAALERAVGVTGLEPDLQGARP